MRLVNSSAIAVALAMLIPPVIGAEGQDRRPRRGRRRDHGPGLDRKD